MLSYHCSECGHERQVPDSYAGRSAKCPKCGSRNTISAPPPIPAEQWAEEVVQSAKRDETVATAATPAAKPVHVVHGRKPEPRGPSQWQLAFANLLLASILAVSLM